VTVPADAPLAQQLMNSTPVAQVRALLLQRQLEQHIGTVLEMIEQTAREVAANLSPPVTAETLSLASWAVVLGAGSAVELALFPEQQDGSAQAELLYRRYVGVLARLRDLSAPAVPDVAGSFTYGRSW